MRTMSARGRIEETNFDLSTRLAKCARLIQRGEFQVAFDEASNSPLWAVISGYNESERDAFLFRPSGVNGKQRIFQLV